MAYRYNSPFELLHALSSNSPGAGKELDDRLRPYVEPLAEIHCETHEGVDAGTLVINTLCWARAHFRHAKADSFREREWPYFTSYSLYQIQTGLLWEPKVPSEIFGPADACFDSDASTEYKDAGRLGYEVHIFLKPYHDVGGDWVFVAVEHDANRMWTFLGDMTGHGWGAHPLKKCVQQYISLIWKDFLERSPPPSSPNDFLTTLGNHLSKDEVLPHDKFVEATAGLFSSDGTVLLAAAGAGYTISSWTGRLKNVEGGTLWLGGKDGVAVLSDCDTLKMESGDELTLASDGLAEQSNGTSQLLDELKAGTFGLTDGRSLHDTLVLLLESAWAIATQSDDTTLLSIVRSEETGRDTSVGTGD